MAHQTSQKDEKHILTSEEQKLLIHLLKHPKIIDFVKEIKHEEDKIKK